MMTGNFVATPYSVGKKCSVYVDLKKSQIDKIKAMFEIGPNMPFIVYFKFKVNFFLSHLKGP
jgi:hypothetical protein